MYIKIITKTEIIVKNVKRMDQRLFDTLFRKFR